MGKWGAEVGEINIPVYFPGKILILAVLQQVERTPVSAYLTMVK